MIAPPTGTSWPSSHPAVLTAFGSVAGRELGAGIVARGGLTALGLAVAASRVYLGVHYPSDVASGFLMGRAVAVVWPRGRDAV
jgi:undecaprenyl-diphosphatase